MRSVRLGLVAGVCTSLTLSGSAEAVTAFGSAHRATRNGCYDSATVQDAKGARFGFVKCTASGGYFYLDYASAAAGVSTWTVHRVASGVTTLLAAADDGTTSYALYDTDNGVHLLKRTRSGAVTQKRLSSHVASSGSIVARSGRYWAVWSAPTYKTPGSLCHYLFQSRTIGATQSAKALGLGCGHDVSVTFGANGSPVMVYRREPWDYGGNIMYSRWSNGWTKPHKLNASGTGKLPFIEHSAHATRVTWLRRTGNGSTYDVMYGSHADGGKWRFTHFTRLYAWDSSIAARPALIRTSNGAVFLAWTAVDSKSRGLAHVVVHRDGGWTARDVTDGTTGDGIVAGLDARLGKAYLTLDHSNASDSYTVVRHQ